MTSPNNLWGGPFDRFSFRTVKEILEEQDEVLTDATRGVVFADVAKSDEQSRLSIDVDHEFGFTYFLRGKFLPDYKYRLFSFSHGMDCYPVMFFDIDEDVFRHVTNNYMFILDSAACAIEARDEESAVSVIGALLSAPRTRHIIAAILKLS